MRSIRTRVLRRSLRGLVWFYPRQWRVRYRTEWQALVEERDPSWRDLPDAVWWAARERWTAVIRSLSGGSMFETHPWLASGLRFGVLLGIAFVAFVAVSTLTSMDRVVWRRVNDVMGILAVALCAAPAWQSALRTRRLAPAVAAGMIAGSIGLVLNLAAVLGVAYGLTDLLRQYPFEHEDFVSSGTATLEEYLWSPNGRREVISTAIGVTFITLPFTMVPAAAGALLGRWWLKPA